MHLVPTRHQDAPAPLGAPWWVVAPMWAPSLISLAHIIPYVQKKITTTTIPVFLLSNPRILNSLFEAPFPKLFGGIATWYVTPPLLQLVFVLVGYF